MSEPSELKPPPNPSGPRRRRWSRALRPMEPPAARAWKIPRSAGARNAKPKSSCVRCAAKPLDARNRHTAAPVSPLDRDAGGAVEFAFYKMAENAGIRAPHACLVHDGERRHFASARFDRYRRPDGTWARHHVHTLSRFLPNGPRTAKLTTRNSSDLLGRSAARKRRVNPFGARSSICTPPIATITDATTPSSITPPTRVDALGPPTTSTRMPPMA
ncbi:MAG: HipA domain-containing protein [Undibacterium sp.]|nr:HipA domain-containing protein [Opitutaceae bacterium]